MKTSTFNSYAKEHSLPLLWVAPGDEVPLAESDILRHDNMAALSSLSRLFASIPQRGYQSKKYCFSELREQFLDMSSKWTTLGRLKFIVRFILAILLLYPSKNYALRVVEGSRRVPRNFFKVCMKVRLRLLVVRDLILHPWRIIPISIIKTTDTRETFLFSPLLPSIYLLTFSLPDYFVDLSAPSRQLRFMMKFPW